LTTIRGNVGLLLKREDIATDDRLAALNDIAGESEQMSRMVQDLLTLARADAGYHLDKAPIDLLPIMQEVTRQAQTLQPLRRTGLGLATARCIAKEHGGQVTAANNPRGGAAFTVELPVQKS